MTMINVLFYLLLLLAGTAVALILADLEKAEASARQALALLEAEPAPGGPAGRFHSACRPVRHPAFRPARQPALRSQHEPPVRPLQAPAFITLADFPAASASPAPIRSDAVPSFDFACSIALAASQVHSRPAAAETKPETKKGQAVSGLPAAGHSLDWNCCA